MKFQIYRRRHLDTGSEHVNGHEDELTILAVLNT